MCEIHGQVASHTHTPTGDLAHYPGMCPDGELNQKPFGLQASAQSTEPDKPGWDDNKILICCTLEKETHKSSTF